MKTNKSPKSPFLLFLPFLILYVTLALTFPSNGSTGDEPRYLKLAQNLLHGFYSSPSPDIDLGNGPGYPIILMPFLALRLPLISITILNAIFYYLSIIILFKTILKVASRKIAFVASLFWGGYLNLYENIPFVLTEIFAVFLISLITICLLNAFAIGTIKSSSKYILASGFLLGYLALTKPIFGYVIMFLITGILILLIANRKSINYRKSILILLMSLATTAPYLIYSFHLTGKVFYWGSNGGNNLYWMSSPYEGEYGSWLQFQAATDKKDGIAGSRDLINLRHQKDFDNASKYKGVAQDSMLKKIAIDNIRSNPTKFIQNCLSNAGRILFNFPYSYKLQSPDTLLRIPFNGTILFMAVLCLIPTVIKWKIIPFAIRFLLFATFLYLGGSLLGSAETRMFTIIVPILLVWVAYIISKSVKIKMDW